MSIKKEKFHEKNITMLLGMWIIFQHFITPSVLTYGKANRLSSYCKVAIKRELCCVEYVSI